MLSTKKQLVKTSLRLRLERVVPILATLLLGSAVVSAQVDIQPRDALQSAGSRRPASVPEGYVITPAGYFHPSCVRVLAKGERLLADGRLQHANGAVDQEAAVCAFPHYTAAGIMVSSTPRTAIAQHAPTVAELPPPEISGWLEDANVTTGSPTSSYGALVAMWTVPPQPKSDDGQTLYFFPGFEDIDGVQSILQPVLGWTAGQWGIASWNCCLNGIVVHSPEVSVSPGDQIYGSVTSTCAAGTLTCATWNILSLDMSTGYSTILPDTPSDGQVFNWAFGAVFEPYYIVSCNDYPRNTHVSFSKVSLFNQNLKLLPTVTWTTSVLTTAPPQCNYSVVPGTGGRQITLSY